MRPSPSDLIGGKYRIVRLIGDGGMGSVFEARHELLGTPVALKFLHPELARRTGLASRFLQEARVSASIQSPHVTRVTDVDQAPDGAPYLVMELLTGESLQQLLDRSGRLPRDQAVDFALQILAGLEAAHALGVVHRDLKPDNVFITPSAGGPLVKLLDFGIAKLRQTGEFQRGLTRPGAVMGTPEYMPPEQLFAADQVDHRADLYSLGAMLYEMLSGQRPASGDDSPASIVVQVMHGQVRRLSELDPTLPPGLVDVVHRAIEPDRERRWSTAVELRRALVPFAGILSPAGRAAAASTAAPATPRTEDEIAPLGTVAERPRSVQGVAPTLPPDDTAPDAPALPGAKGSTQDVPEHVLQEIATSLQVAVPSPVAGYTASSASYVATGAYARPRRPARRGHAVGAVVALLLGLLVTGGGIAALVLLRGQQDDSESPLGLPSSLPPATTIAAQSPEPDAGAAPPKTTALPPTATAGKGGKAVPRDAGPDAPAEGGLFQLPFPFPSALPPFPSTFPPLLPSVWPPVFPPSNVQE